jgi:hypothetical protein
VIVEALRQIEADFIDQSEQQAFLVNGFEWYASLPNGTERHDQRAIVDQQAFPVGRQRYNPI